MCATQGWSDVQRAQYGGEPRTTPVTANVRDAPLWSAIPAVTTPPMAPPTLLAPIQYETVQSVAVGAGRHEFGVRQQIHIGHAAHYRPHTGQRGCRRGPRTVPHSYADRIGHAVLQYAPSQRMHDARRAHPDRSSCRQAAPFRDLQASSITFVRTTAPHNVRSARIHCCRARR